MAGALVASLAVLASLPIAPTSAAEPAARQVLVVTINLTETEVRDVRDTSDVELFVQRLAKGVPHVPDIVLAQEVRLKSARNTAAALSQVFGQEFAVGVAPAADPMWHKELKTGALVQFTQQSAVIYNATTMEMAGTPRYAKTSYRDGDLKVVRKHPYGTLRELASGMKITAASVHLFRPVKISSDKRAAHAGRIATAVEREAGTTGSSLSTMGGDFNEWRGEDGDPTPFYRSLLALHDYEDAIPLRGVDYVFAKGDAVRVADWGKDVNDKAYSLHAFRWSLFGN